MVFGTLPPRDPLPIDTLTLNRARDAMELVNYGLFLSMAYNAATVVASIHHARSLVLIHSTHSKDADLKIKLITQNIMIQGHLEKCFFCALPFLVP